MGLGFFETNRSRNSLRRIGRLLSICGCFRLHWTGGGNHNKKGVEGPFFSVFQPRWIGLLVRISIFGSKVPGSARPFLWLAGAGVAKFPCPPSQEMTFFDTLRPSLPGFQVIWREKNPNYGCQGGPAKPRGLYQGHGRHFVFRALYGAHFTVYTPYWPFNYCYPSRVKGSCFC